MNSMFTLPDNIEKGELAKNYSGRLIMLFLENKVNSRFTPGATNQQSFIITLPSRTIQGLSVGLVVVALEVLIADSFE